MNQISMQQLHKTKGGTFIPKTMKFELNDDNFLMFALKAYNNPSCSGMKEFLDDLKIFKYLTRLFRRYRAKKDLKERLIINHLVVLYNIFGAEAATKMLFFKINKEHWPSLKTFLVYPNLMSLDDPAFINVPTDENIEDILGKI